MTTTITCNGCGEEISWETSERSELHWHSQEPKIYPAGSEHFHSVKCRELLVARIIELVSELPSQTEIRVRA